MNEYQFGRYFEDFKIGDTYKHRLGKTITESDNNLFCLITMNHHPVHLDHNFASTAKHKKILVAGTLTFSLVVGLTVPDISGSAIANLCYENVDHLEPVFINDTIYANSIVLEKKRSSSEKMHGVITVQTTAHNQHGQKVLLFHRKILVPMRPT